MKLSLHGTIEKQAGQYRWLLCLFVLATGLPVPPIGAAGLAATDSSAAAVLARYTTAHDNAVPWRTETIEIDARLLRFAERGRLRAIRRLLPIGRPQYQVLEIEGDRTVRQQVIARYLSEDVRAAELSPSSVALTPANYKFRYKGTAQTAGGTAYVYLINPRKKREGLIKGELWLDAATGEAVRQSGYFVKKPSIFVKRIDVIRENELRDGAVEMRITHLSILTRLAGLAELTIQERPVQGTDTGHLTGGMEQ